MERSEILTEEWLMRCWNERNNRKFDPFEQELVRKYRAKPLHNLHLLFFGFNHDLEHFHTLTIENGLIFINRMLFLNMIIILKMICFHRWIRN